MFNAVKKEELRVPAEMDSLKRVRDFIAQIGKKYRFSEKVINAFKLAADEACTNIIRHAYRDRSGDITVRAIIRKKSLTISLIDQGRYFDPNQVKDPDLKRYVAIGKRGGLGIFMIRRLVDEIDYRRTSEGNELRLTKNQGVERKPLLSIPSIPMSMRVRYYSISAAIVTLAILVLYIYNFVKVDDKILGEAFTRMQSIATILSRNSIDGLLDDDYLALSKEAKIIVTQNTDFVAIAVITDANNEIKGTTEPALFPPFRKFELGAPEHRYRNNVEVFKLNTATDEQPEQWQEFFVVRQPVYPRGEENVPKIGDVHLFVPAKPIFDRIHAVRMQNLRLALIVLVVANLGLGLLIILILTPLQRLASWVRNVGEGGIEDAIEIDSSTEIGKIAQAFSEITDKFRESQKSLAEQERLQQEMHLAKEIQQTLLPSEFPEIEGYEIASYYESAKEVGGDYYDFVEVDKNRLGVVVADVSGKGVPGSLVMTMIRTAMRTEAKGRDSAAEVLARVNDFVLGDIRKGMFVTLFYMILDSRKRRITFASAGHNPLILYRSLTKKTYYLNPKGFPVGISLTDKDLFRRSIEDDTIQLTKGDILLCHTDGITEAMNSKREMFGEERLLQVVRQYGHLRAKEFVEKLREELISFTEGQIQNDDITLVVIKENMSAEEAEYEIARQVYYQMLSGKSMTEACNELGMPVSRFKQKYKAKFEKLGEEAFLKEFETTSVEAKHLSIEEITKIYDIIRKHPEWGAKRISEQLNTEEYGYTKISEWRIYQELKRKRLNTRALREAYVSRGAHKKRMKPPGTPMLTLDGKIIMEEQLGPKLTAPLEPVRPSDQQPPEKPGEGEGKAGGEKPKSRAAPKALPKPPKKKEPPLEEREVSDIVLGDLVELLDKSREEGEETPPDLEELLPEEIAEGTEEAPEHSLDQIEEVELDEGVKKILGGVSEEPEPPAEEDLTALDSATDTAKELAEELFVDQAEEEETRQEKGEAGAGEESAEGEGEDILSRLSVEVEEPSGNSEEDLIDLLSPEESLQDEVLQEQAEEQEQEENPAAVTEEPAEEQPESATVPGEEEPEPEKIFEELSVEVGEGESAYQDIGETADKKIDDFLDLLADEGISLEEIEEATETASSGEEKHPPTKDEELKQKLLLAGGYFYMNKKYEKAIAILRRLVEQFPDTVEAYYNLGNAYYRLKNWEEAKKAYEKVCELDPTYVNAWENLGVIYANERNFKEAIQVWKRILEMDPNRKDVKSNIEKALRLYKET